MAHSQLEMNPAYLPITELKRIVGVALDEDIARGDITSEACIDVDARGEAHFVARDDMVVCGIDVVAETFRQVGNGTDFHPFIPDGVQVEKGESLASIQGNARQILLGERVALNLFQRMTGIATTASRYVAALPSNSQTRIADTRKTTPGLRAIERYAIRCGGAFNHRYDLSSGVLIKDNHIAAAGGVREAIQRAKEYAPHSARIECEVDTLEQMHLALDAGADIIMLDNFDDDAVRDAMEILRDKVIVEVSGGITIERIRELGEIGVDVISSGALTHSIVAADIGLDWR